MPESFRITFYAIWRFLLGLILRRMVAQYEECAQLPKHILNSEKQMGGWHSLDFPYNIKKHSAVNSPPEKEACRNVSTFI